MIEGHAFRLREVTLDDVDFIIELRTNPALNKFINETSHDRGRQVAWLERQISSKDDYYFVVEGLESQEKNGLISLYNIDRSNQISGEWGRWILKAKSIAAIESALLIYQLGFETFKMDRIFCRTLEPNKSVLSFHEMCGLQETARHKGYARIRGILIDAIEHSVEKESWPFLKEMLEARAMRLSRRFSNGG